MDGFRWQTGAFRDYGVTKAEVIIWMLREGRCVVRAPLTLPCGCLEWRASKKAPCADR